MDTLIMHVIVYVPASDSDARCEAFMACIKGIGSNWHQVHDVWLVESALRGQEIRERLRGMLHPEDQLLISKLDDDAVWQGFDWSGSEWLRRKLK
jgi:hypothetical protein